MNINIIFFQAPEAENSDVLRSRVDHKSPVRQNTICICCDEASTQRHLQNHLYNRRQLLIDEDEIQDQEMQMQRLLTERAMIEQELDCSQHEPIEVVLIFDPKKTKKSKPKFEKNKFTLTPPKKKNNRVRYRKPKPVTESVPSSTVYYDPTKLSFIFSTPSPISKRYIELRDKGALEELKQMNDDDDDVQEITTENSFFKPNSQLESSDFQPTKRKDEETIVFTSDDVYFPSSVKKENRQRISQRNSLRNVVF